MNFPLARIASSVRLGVATLKDTTGAGLRASDVKEDIVMARGVGGRECVPGVVEVQTTTECASSRISARSCSDMGRVSDVDECGWTEGCSRGATFQVCLAAREVCKHLAGMARMAVSGEVTC